MKPYVVRFVSSRADTGKTEIGSRVLSLMRARGYVVGVVKHCPHGVDLEYKDTHRYFASGADIVVASSSSVGIVYYRAWVDSLEHALRYVNTPIVFVEGFKEAGLGDVTVIANDMDEAVNTRASGNIIAYVVKNTKGSECSQIPLIPYEDVEKLANLIEVRALEHITGQLPGANCGHCGFGSCREQAIAYAKGVSRGCPAIAGTRLLVDGKEVALNPFVKRLLKAILSSFVDTLKDVPKERRKIVVELAD